MSRVVGGAQTLSKMRDRFPGAYPRSLVKGSGAYVWDSDRRWYRDWISALGAISLGYCDDVVDAAVIDQVRRGSIFSLPDIELEEAVAEQLCALIPCAEAVRFVKTGSEATEAAIRVARAATGRDVILTCGYHGWHSWYAATRTEAPGVPILMYHLAHTFPYNDLDKLREIIQEERHPYDDTCRGDYVESGVAAIILEPTLYEPPAPGFLAGVVRMAHEAGALVIFDEMVTGFRWHAGGAQALYGVMPDLATFGKGMGNGYPIAALVGRAKLMQHARLVSGTFGGDCIGLAAARATMSRYQRGLAGRGDRGDVCGHMWDIGEALMNGYNAIAADLGAPTRMDGQPPHPRIVWDEVDAPDPSHPAVPDSVKNRHRASLFFQECAKRGVLFHPDGISIMGAHTSEDVYQTLRVCEQAFALMVHAIDRGSVRAQIEGDPISPEPPWRVTQ